MRAFCVGAGENCLGRCALQALSERLGVEEDACALEEIELATGGGIVEYLSGGPRGAEMRLADRENS